MKTFVTCMLMIAAIPCGAQQFTRITNSPVTSEALESGGSSWTDLDGDGFLDVFVANGNLTNQNNSLFKNLGRFQFIKVQTGAIVLDGGSSIGGVWADPNGDGKPDLFVSNRQNFGNFLYYGINDTVFSKSGAQPALDIANSNSATFVDIDGDGDLDLHVVNFQGNDFFYVNSGPPNFQWTVKDTMAFVRDGSNFSITGSWADMNNDFKPDYVACNAGSQADVLYINRGNFRFDAVSLGDATNSIGCSWGDFDNDGDLDLVVTSTVGQTCVLYVNSGSPDYTLTPVPVTALSTPGNYVGSAWGDYDNDGYLDLLIGSDGGNNLLLKNSGPPNYTLQAVTDAPLTSDGGNTFGVAWVDMDNDGDLDILAANRSNQNNFLYKNNGTTNHFIGIDAVGAGYNTSSLGAKVHVYDSPSGNVRHQLREVLAQSGYNSQVTRVHAGVGTTQVIDSIVVEWPGGARKVLVNVKADQILRVHENSLNTETPFIPAFRPDPVYAQVPLQFSLPAYAHPFPQFSLLQKPSGMTIDAATGALSWTPGLPDVGGHTVKVIATNTAGADTLTFTLDVLSSQAPAASAFKDHNLFAGSLIKDTLTASGVPQPTFRLIEGPSGLQLDSVTGIYQWNILNSDTGMHHVRMAAVNAVGGDTIGIELRVELAPTIAVFQNPASGANADLAVVSRLKLIGAPVITLIRGIQSTNVPVSATIDTSVFIVPVTFDQSGDVQLRVTATPVGGVPSLQTRNYTVLPLKSVASDIYLGEDWFMNVSELREEKPPVLLMEKISPTSFWIGPERTFTHAIRLEYASGNTGVDLFRKNGDDWQKVARSFTGKKQIFVTSQLGLFRSEIAAGRSMAASHADAAAVSPNPFNPSTTLSLELTVASSVAVTIYNILGQQVRRLTYGLQPPGRFSAFWNGQDQNGHALGSGVYVYAIKTSYGQWSGKMLMIK